jgi:hypothetical protein
LASGDDTEEDGMALDKKEDMRKAALESSSLGGERKRTVWNICRMDIRKSFCHPPSSMQSFFGNLIVYNPLLWQYSSELPGFASIAKYIPLY